jgi:hypothetical protein
MRTTQFEVAVKSLINTVMFETVIDDKIRKVVHSGAIDIDAISENDYTEVKAAAYVIATQLAEQIRPLSKEGRKAADNLAKFI